MSVVYFHDQYGPQVFADGAPCPEGFYDNADYYLDYLETLKPTVEEARVTKLAELRQIRIDVEYGGFILNEQLWDSGLKDELRLNSTIKLMEQQKLTEFTGWKISEGIYITLTPELALQAAIAMATHYAWCFKKETQIADEIATLTSVGAIQVYKIIFDDTESIVNA